MRQRLAGWADRLDDDASDAMIERALREFGVAKYRAIHFSRKPELTGSVVREILERYGEYAAGVRSPGPYISRLAEEARAAIRDQHAADQAARFSGRQAAAEALQDRVDALTDRAFVELAVRCELWPAIERPTRTGAPLRTFRTVYVQAVQAAFKRPELLDGLEVDDV